MDKAALAERLKKERMSNGVIMQTLADVIGVETVGTYYKKETGMLNFSLTEAMALAKFYGKTVEELFGDSVA